MAIRKFLVWVLDSMSGRTWKGCRNRLLVAVVFSVIGIAVDTCFVMTNYDYMPTNIVTFYDWDYTALESENKSVLWDYELQRIVFLLLMVMIGWLIYRKNRASLVRFRTFTLFAEMANLVILTGVGVSMVMLALSMGDESQNLSNKWEWLVCLFWFALLMMEYVGDIRCLRKQTKA